jgi:hypothetical protein
MKRYLAIAFSALVFSPSLMLAGTHGNQGMAGCGLGYMVMRDDNSKVMQVLGATTNGTSYNQLFGITSGTLGCTQDGAYKVAKAAEAYAEANLDSLRHEMASGQGEYVTTFVSMLGAKGQNVPQVVSVFQKNYVVLFPTSATTPAEFLDTVTKLLAVRPELLS